MSDWTEDGAVPVDDAAVENPPTVSEVEQHQREVYPDQAATTRHGRPGEHLEPEELSEPGHPVHDEGGVAET